MFDSLSDNSPANYIQENCGKYLEPLKGDKKVLSKFILHPDTTSSSLNTHSLKNWALVAKQYPEFRYICLYLPSNR